MDKEIQASQIYSRVLYSRRRGCALWVPEPNNDLPPAYLETGVQIGDVGILRADGRFSFIFNACCSANDPVNRYGVPDNFQPLRWDNSHIRNVTEPDGFQQVAGKWDGPRDIIPNYFRPGEPVMSRGAEKRALGAEASVSVPGVPVGVGTGFSITFAKHRGAVILPPNGVISVDCEGQRLFREYAEKNYDSWYRYLHERRGMEVEDGSIYFLTGFDKTDCWEIAVFSNNLKERMCEIIVNTGGLAGGDGRLKFSDCSHLETASSRCSPSNNTNLNQALFIRGFRISRPRKLRSFFSGLGVEVTSTYDSSWKETIGKKGSYFPYSRGGSSSSGAGSSQSTGSGSLGAGPSTTFSDRVDNGSSPNSSRAGTDSAASSDDDGLTPPSELYHPSKVINDYILQSAPGIKAVITHDEDWISLLNDEDIELPDDATLVQRLLDRCRVTVKDGCALIDHFVRNPQQPIPIEESGNSNNEVIITTHGAGEAERIDANLEHVAFELLDPPPLPEESSTESLYSSHDQGTSSDYAVPEVQYPSPTSCHVEALHSSPLPDTPYNYNLFPMMHHNSVMYGQASQPPPSRSEILPTSTYPAARSTPYTPAHGHQADPQQNIPNFPSSATLAGGLKKSSPHDLPMRTRRQVSFSARKDVHPYFPKRRPIGDFSDDDDDELAELPPNASEQEQIEHRRRLNTLAARKSRKRKELYRQELEQRVETLTMEAEKWKTRAQMLRRIIEGRGLSVPDWSDEEVEPERDSVRRDERTTGYPPPVPGGSGIVPEETNWSVGGSSSAVIN